MLTTITPNNRKPLFLVSLLTLSLFGLSARAVTAQTLVKSNSTGHSFLLEKTDTAKKAPVPSSGEKKPETTDEKLNALEEMLAQQNERLNQLQQTISEQQETIRLLVSKVSGPAVVAPGTVAVARVETEPATVQHPSVEDRLQKVETRVGELGAIKFSGDIRLRAESILGQQNILANGDNPAVLGNELSPRHRMRLRARLQMRGSINDEFDWGLRFATGSFADNISTNQTLTSSTASPSDSTRLSSPISQKALRGCVSREEGLSRHGLLPR